MIDILNPPTHIAKIIRDLLGETHGVQVFTDTIPDLDSVGEAILLVEVKKTGDIVIGGEVEAHTLDAFITVFTDKKSVGREIGDLIRDELYTYGFDIRGYLQRLDEDSKDEGSALELTLLEFKNKHYNSINYRKELII